MKITSRIRHFEFDFIDFWLILTDENNETAKYKIYDDNMVYCCSSSYKRVKKFNEHTKEMI